MSEENKAKQIDPLEPSTAKEEAKVIETTTETTTETNDDIFITEKDTFEGSIRYYKVDKELKVQKVDDDFDEKSPFVKEIKFTCKYPSQADFQTLVNSPAYKNISEMRPIDLMTLEVTRLSILIRSWSIKHDLLKLNEADPKIIRAMLIHVNEVLGLRGIL